MSSKISNVLVFDNDECIVSASLPSGFYGFIKMNYPDSIHHLKQSFAILFDSGVLRPGAKQMFETIKEMKFKGIVDKVVMYTSAPNTNGWVDFLKDSLEEYLDCKGIYDLVLHRDNVPIIQTACGATMKFLDRVKEHLGDANILMFDDKPENIVGNGIICGIPPYSHLITPKIWDEVLNDFWSRYMPGEDFKKSKVYTILHSPQGYQMDRIINMRLGRPENQLSDRHIIKLGVKHLSQLTTGLDRTTSGDLSTRPQKKLKTFQKTIFETSSSIGMERSLSC